MSDFPEVELIFVSGVLDQSIWKHQEKYFSRNCSVETVGGGRFSEVRQDLLEILNTSENAVVIGAELGNLIAQSVEEHENVISTVITGPLDRRPVLGEKSFKAWSKILQHPKFVKKVFFSKNSNYDIVKQASLLLDNVDFESYRSFIGKNLRVPLKNSLIIYNQECRFSSMKGVEDLKSNSQIALLDAGSFSFYEKPQEYNKALHDYLLGKKDLLEKRELVKAASENRSLKDFEDKLGLNK